MDYWKDERRKPNWWKRVYDMSISNVYTNQVSNKRITFASKIPLPPFERDQNILKLEKNVFNKFKELGALDDARNNQTSEKPILKKFSFEDAIKDLLNIKKTS